jgi:sorbitol-specific phosphotransferase system component IIC
MNKIKIKKKKTMVYAAKHVLCLLLPYSNPGNLEFFVFWGFLAGIEVELRALHLQSRHSTA